MPPRDAVAPACRPRLVRAIIAFAILEIVLLAWVVLTALSRSDEPPFRAE